MFVIASDASLFLYSKSIFDFNLSPPFCSPGIKTYLWNFEDFEAVFSVSLCSFWLGEKVMSCGLKKLE